MPVDAAQALVGEEGAGTAGEGVVDKGGLKEVEDGRGLGRNERRQFGIGCSCCNAAATSWALRKAPLKW